jgi:hypothetical protein
LPQSQYEQFLGKDIYVLVLKKFDVPEEDILRSEVCAKRDALCLTMVNAAREMEFTTVAVHSTVAIQKVFVPRSEYILPGDIIKIRIATDIQKAPMFVSLAARARDRLAKQCDWVDGNQVYGTGGVSCNGWSYKNVTKL